MIHLFPEKASAFREEEAKSVVKLKKPFFDTLLTTDAKMVD